MSEFPYPGLRPFLRHETDIFFGREEQIDQLLERLDDTRFLSIVGPSGCGKSSLVRAGLIAALEAGFLVAAGARWRTATMRPGTAPLASLARALCAETALGPERRNHANATSFMHSTLRRGPRGLLEILDETPLPERTSLLILVDQFEEIFRYRREGNREEAEAFVALLLATVADPKGNVYIVTTMRSDFLDDCTLFHGLPEATNDSQFLTPRLTREQIRACIEGPAGVFGGAVDPALANRILNDMGDDPDQLPLMQHALMRMWLIATRSGTGIMQRPDFEADEATASPVFPPGKGPTVTIEDYEAVGTLAEALSQHADKSFESLDEEGQRIAEVMFRSLSERGPKDRDTRRPTSLGEVAAVAGVEPEQVMEVVEVFRKPGRSFVTPPAGEELTPASILDISHESLIRQWGQMAEWVVAEARSGETYRRLEETAKLWKRHLAAPWRRPDLDLALAWKALEQPTEEWSKRYGNAYELAMEFLDESERARQERHAEEEQARQNELEQARALAEAEKKRADAESKLAQEHVAVIKRLRKFSLAIGIAALAAVIGGVAAWQLLRDVRRQERKLTEQRLETQALQLLGTNQELAVLLAAEARRGLEDGADDVLGEETLLKTLSSFFHVSELDPTKGSSSSDGVRDMTIPPTTCGAQEIVAEIDRHGIARLSRLDEATPTNGESTLVPPPQARRLAVSRDCRWVALLHPGPDGDAVALWAGPAPSGEPDLVLPAGGSVADMAFSPNGSRLGVAHDRGARVWHVQSSDPSLFLDLTQPAALIRFSPHGGKVATAHRDSVFLWSLTTGDELQRLDHEAPVTTIAFAPEGPQGTPEWLGAASGTDAYLWDLESATAPERVFRDHRALITDIAFSPIACNLPDGNEDCWLATSSLDNTVRLWDLGRFFDNPEPGRTPKEMPHPEGVLTIEFRPPDGRWLATGSEDDLARVWDISTLATSAPLELPHGESVTELSFSPDGSRLATGSGNRSTKVWQLDQPTALPHVEPYEGKIPGLAFARGTDSTLLLATASQYEIRFRTRFSPGAFESDGSPEANNGEIEPLRRPPADGRDPGKFVDIVFNDDGTRLVSRRETGVVEVFDRRGSAFEHADTWRGTITAMAWSTDGDTIVTADEHQQIHLWSARGSGSPTESNLVSTPNDEVAQLAVGGNNGGDPLWLAASDYEGYTRLWYLPEIDAGPLEIPSDIRPDSRVAALAFDPEARWLVIGYWNDAAHLYRLTGPDQGGPGYEHLHTLHHRDAVRAIAFSPDGSLLATGSGDHLVRLWKVPDPAQGDSSAAQHDLIELYELPHRDAVLSIAFSPDGNWLATGSLDNQVRILPLEQQRLEAVACKAAQRNLTRAEWDEHLPNRPVQKLCPDYPGPE